MIRSGLIVLLVAAGILLISSTYVVDETQQVVVTMFGKVVGKPVQEPGLHFKLPFLHQVNVFPRNLLEWDGDKGQIPTKDKTFIWVDVFGRWRIVDPLLFFEKVRDESTAQRNLDGIIDAAIRNLITSNNLIEAVRNSNRKMENEIFDGDAFTDSTNTMLKIGRSKICQLILSQAQGKLANFGIGLVDLKFKRINYVDDVLQKVYERMVAERRQIAEKYRSEGRGESLKILGEKEKELQRISSEAYKVSQKIKGEADAEATAIYAAAYNRDPEFYSFMKTLEIYKQTFDSTNVAFLSVKNNDFLKYFKQYMNNK